uniref:Uncharacterized protein n=2 Tax=Phlebotomus papatasi TaxID=29031 RepID=A0A1B0DM22_PHLPP
MMQELSDYIYVGSPDTPPRAVNSDEEMDTISLQSSSISSVELSREVDYEITIKLKWKDQIERIPYTNQQPFQDLLKMLAEREGTTEKKIVLMMNDSIVYATDTPSSIGYTSVHFISGRVVDSVLEPNKKVKKVKTDIEVKIQSDRWKRPLAVSVPKTDTVQKLLEMCAKALECSTNDINLRFDGEILSETMTMQDLELEGGEMIDCVFKGGRKK